MLRASEQQLCKCQHRSRRLTPASPLCRKPGLYLARAPSEKAFQRRASGWWIYKLQSPDANGERNFTPVKNLTSSLSRVFLPPCPPELNPASRLE